MNPDDANINDDEQEFFEVNVVDDADDDLDDEDDLDEGKYGACDVKNVTTALDFENQSYSITVEFHDGQSITRTMKNIEPGLWRGTAKGSWSDDFASFEDDIVEALEELDSGLCGIMTSIV